MWNNKEIHDELIRLLNKNQSKIIEETNVIYINIPIEHVKIKGKLFVVNEITKNDSDKLMSYFQSFKYEKRNKRIEGKNKKWWN